MSYLEWIMVVRWPYLGEPPGGLEQALPALTALDLATAFGRKDFDPGRDNRN